LAEIRSVTSEFTGAEKRRKKKTTAVKYKHLGIAMPCGLIMIGLMIIMMMTLMTMMMISLAMYLDKTQLQFGRVGQDEFSLDYSHPFTGLQAFAVAVTSLTTKVFGP